MSDKADNQKDFTRPLIIALAGNPNAGKTTLFNALTGSNQRVSNYPGNTVERIEGAWKLKETTARLVDLPGLYSLDADSDDQTVASKVLRAEYEDLPKPDAVIAVVDATNLKRNHYLVTELLELRLPLVVALTMFDEAEEKGVTIDIERLSQRLGAPVVAVTAATKRGLAELAEKTLAVAGTRPEIPAGIEALARLKGEAQAIARNGFAREITRECVTRAETPETTSSDRIDRVLTHKFLGLPILFALVFLVFLAVFSVADLPMSVTEYGFFRLGEAVKYVFPETLFTALLVDGVIGGVGGVVVFVWQIALLFLFISLLEDVGYLARATFLLDRLMRGFGLNGRAFMPLFSSFACAIPGIMATRSIGDKKDRLLTIIIAPFMSCSARLPVYILLIPLVLRENYGLRGAFLMVAMYLLGIIAAIAVAFVLKRSSLKAPLPPLVMELPPYRLPQAKTVLLNVWKNVKLFLLRAGTVIFAISLILWALQTFPTSEFAALEKTLLALLMALIVSLGAKRIIARLRPKRVQIQSLAPRSAKMRRLSEKMLVALAVLGWALIAYVPQSQSAGWLTEKPDAGDEIAEKQKAKNSYAGRIGAILSPAVKTLGIGVAQGNDGGEAGDALRGEIGFALIASFAAREVFVSAWKMSSLGSKAADPDPPAKIWADYKENLAGFWSNLWNGKLGDMMKDDEDAGLQDAMAKNNFTPLNALTLMVFFVLAMQCSSTLAVVWRETRSWLIPVAMFAGMTLLAYTAALLTSKAGILFQ